MSYILKAETTNVHNMTKLPITVLIFICHFFPAFSYAQDTEGAWQQLRQGKAVALIRHALAPGFSDPAGFLVDDCTTQRLLSEEGRQQAVHIGDVFRANGIDDANMLSSHWCRCVDTAQLMGLGEVVIMSALNSFFENRAAANEQTAHVLEAMPGWLQDNNDNPTVLVTHQVNISAITGAATGSGEILIVTLKDDSVQILASITTR